MLEDLERGNKLVGVKQCNRAIKDETAKQAFFACDAEHRIIDPLISLCKEKSIPYTHTQTMKELGEACGIEVGAAVAVIL